MSIALLTTIFYKNHTLQMMTQAGPAAIKPPPTSFIHSVVYLTENVHKSSAQKEEKSTLFVNSCV